VSNVSLVGAGDLPLHVGIVIDESGSARNVGLHDVEIQRALDSTSVWLQTHRGDAFLVGFNDQIIISTELVADVSDLRKPAGQLRPIGGSAIRDALVHAAQKFGSLNPEPQQAVRIILLISDGHDNASNTSESRAIEAAQREGVRVYSITFPSREVSTGKHLLETIARGTGGTAFSPSDDSQLTTALTEIGDDLANSFLVTFTPETQDGKFHSIKIRVRDLPDKALRFMPAFVTVQP
jgi:VWFA-related protein